VLASAALSAIYFTSKTKQMAINRNQKNRAEILQHTSYAALEHTVASYRGRSIGPWIPQADDMPH